MANFTQSNPIQYKDYVSTQPIEAETLVGSQREEELRQGIQKVNDVYSRVAGVDVLRGVDKQYLQNNLDSLKQGITNNLSGDFSDSRITSQITGAATQIYRDPVIQNAIISTAQVRKGQSDLDEYRKAGKGSPAQEYVYNQAVNQYANSTDPTASFNTRAKPNTEYKKHAVEGLKALTGDESITDDAFTTDGKGHLVLADNTIRKKYSGITPQRIQSMLMNYLTPDDFDQISAEGRYNYSNKSDQQFANDLQNSYNDKHEVAQNYITQLQSAKTKTKDPQALAQLDQNIAGEQQRLKGIEDEYNNITISGDVESAKAQKATFDFIHGFSNSFAYTQKSETYAGKTPQENMQWRQDFKQKADQFTITKNQQEKFHEDQMALDYEKLNREHPKDKLGNVASGGFELGRNQGELATLAPTEEKVQDNISKTSSYLDVQKDAAIQDFISKGNIIPENINTSDKKAVGNYIDGLKSSWAINPNNVDASVARYFDDVFKDSRNTGQMQATLSDIQKQASDKFNIDKLIPKAPAHTLYDSKESYSYTPKDFVNAISKFGGYVSTTDIPSGISGGSQTSVNINWDKAKKELSPKEYFLFEKNYSGDKTVNNYVNDYTNKVIIPNNNLIDQRNKFVKDQLSQRFLAQQAGQYNIPTDKEAEIRQAGGLLTDVADYAKKSFNGSLPNAPNWDEATARKLAADPKTFYKIQVNSGSTFDPAAYSISASDANGNYIEAPLTLEQKRARLGNDYEDVKSIQFDKDYGEALQMAGGSTTSLGGKNFLVTRDFGSLKSFGTVGNVIKVGDKYQYDLQVRDPIKNTMVTLKLPRNPVDKDALIDARDTLTDDVVFTALYGRAPSIQDRAILEKAAKTNISY